MNDSQKVTQQTKGYGFSEGSTIEADPINISRAEGVYLWDQSGTKYLDFFSQTWSMPLGHNHPKVIEAVRKQLDKVTHLRTAFTTDEKVELAEKIIEEAPKMLNKVNFTLHGSLAVEGAMKLAINYHDGRDKIMYLEDGFHGRSLATMGISWKIKDVKYHNYFLNGVEAKKNLEDIELKMKNFRPAAIVLELVQGNCGFLILDKDLVKGIRELCYKYDVVMIIDEIQTGFGCTNSLFMTNDYEVFPDIITFGKGIGGGFPLAGMVYKEKFSFKAGEHSFTFAHSPVSFAAGLASLSILKEESYRADTIEIYMKERLEQLKKKHKMIKEVRCIGTKAALDIYDGDMENSCNMTADIVNEMLKRGIIISASRYRKMGNTIMMQPPLVTTITQLHEACNALDEVMNLVFREKSKSFMLFGETGEKKNAPFMK